jgi:hypothetical protein
MPTVLASFESITKGPAGLTRGWVQVGQELMTTGYFVKVQMLVVDNVDLVMRIRD